jgi:GNAT superfamily N-acetyltransferase
MDSLPRTVTLADGSRAELRLWRPDDAPALLRGFASLSSASRHARFLAAKTELDDADVAALTAVDGVDHVVVVAVADSPDLKTDVGLGIGRFLRLPRAPGDAREGPSDVAEGAVTVADAAQNKGVGRALLEALAELAREHGIRALRAEVLASNARIRRLLEEAGGVVIEDHGETLEFEVALDDPLPDASEAARAHPLRRLLRAAAEAFAALRS